MKSASRNRQVFPLDALTIARNSPEPLQRQLYRAIAHLISSRVLPAGAELPSTRALSVDLGLGRNTIVAVYDQLITEGYLLNRPGARPTVVDLPAVSPRPSPAVIAGEGRPLSKRGRALLDQRVHHGVPGRHAFHPGMPDARSFPFGVWAKLLARRAAFAGDRLFGTYDINGLPALREAIAGYLASARGIRCRPDQIVVTTGAQAAFDLLARLLLDPGDTVWMEEPGYYGAQAAFNVAGAHILPLPVDNHGWRFAAPPPGTRLIYVTPACQHPLGITMPVEQRLSLLEVAERFDSWIIEDDFDGEYRFVGRPVPALQGMDNSGRVIYVGTFAKLLFPALRLGFIVLPPALQRGFANALSTTGQFAPLLLQAALADFIMEGHMTRHLKRMRRLYAGRRQAFLEICAERLGSDMEILPCEAGIQLVGRLRVGLHDIQVADALAARGVNVTPMSKYFRHQPTMRGLVMGYAACDEAQTVAGIRQIREVLQAHKASSED
ncbi:MAG: rhizopine catabolism transcriptional regulator MocR [Shinella sp.]